MWYTGHRIFVPCCVCGKEGLILIPSNLGNAFLWVAVIIVGIAVEAATFYLISIWFAVGALAALVTLTIGGSFFVQLLVFAVVSALMLALVRPFTRHLLRPKGARTNADRILGEAALVTEEIDNAQAKGTIKVFGQVWSARSADGAVIPAGETVRICSISGVKAIVERINARKEN